MYIMFLSFRDFGEQAGKQSGKTHLPDGAAMGLASFLLAGMKGHCMGPVDKPSINLQTNLKSQRNYGGEERKRRKIKVKKIVSKKCRLACLVPQSTFVRYG